MPYTEGGPDDQQPSIETTTEKETKNVTPENANVYTTPETVVKASNERLQSLGFSNEHISFIQDILSGKIHKIPDDNDSDNSIMGFNADLTGIQRRIQTIQAEQQKGKKSNPDVISHKTREILNQLANIIKSPYISLSRQKQEGNKATEQSTSHSSIEQSQTEHSSLFDSQERNDFMNITNELKLTSWMQVCKSLEDQYLTTDRKEYNWIVDNKETSVTQKIEGIQNWLNMCCANKMFGSNNIKDLDFQFQKQYAKNNLDNIPKDPKFARLNFLYNVEHLPWGTQDLPRKCPTFMKEIINAIPNNDLQDPNIQKNLVTFIYKSISDENMIHRFEGTIGRDKMNYFINTYITENKS